MTDCDNCDLKDRAVMYYNLFKLNIESAKKIILGENKKMDIEEFWEDQVSKETEKIETEFNTFSVTYRKPQEKFMKREYIKNLTKKTSQEEYEETTNETTNTVKISANPPISKDLLVFILLQYIGFGYYRF